VRTAKQFRLLFRLARRDPFFMANAQKPHPAVCSWSGFFGGE